MKECVAIRIRKGTGLGVSLGWGRVYASGSLDETKKYRERREVYSSKLCYRRGGIGALGDLRLSGEVLVV